MAAPSARLAAPAARQVATASADCTVRLWSGLGEGATSQHADTFFADGPLLSAACAPQVHGAWGLPAQAAAGPPARRVTLALGHTTGALQLVCLEPDVYRAARR